MDSGRLLLDSFNIFGHIMCKEVPYLTVLGTQELTVTEEETPLRYMLRSLDVLVKGSATLCGYNLGMIISCTSSDLELKKKHMKISYH